VDEGGVDHAVRGGCCTAQAFEVFERAAMYRSSGGGQRLGADIRTSKAKHLMPCADELLNNGRTDETSGPGEKYLHESLLSMYLPKPPLTGRRVPVESETISE
jgi:hypothetical protein